jgi:polysaccharide pyruvyl transferase WcaK-like protein
MHPSIFAAASGTPIVGLAYNPKFHGFFSLLGLEDYVMDVGDFVNLGLIDELAELTSMALTKKIDTSKQIDKLKNDVHSFNRMILGLES